MNVSTQIIITIIDKDQKKKDVSVPVTAKISEIFPEQAIIKNGKILNADMTFQSSGILYGDILELCNNKGG